MGTLLWVATYLVTMFNNAGWPVSSTIALEAEKREVARRQQEVLQLFTDAKKAHGSADAESWTNARVRSTTVYPTRVFICDSVGVIDVQIIDAQCELRLLEKKK
jgi:hypothetical protein